MLPELADRPTAPSGLPPLPPMRDKLPTLPCDLSNYAWDQTGPESWTADRVEEIEEEDFVFDEASCVAGPLIGVRGSDIPRPSLPEDECALLELDHREGFILSLLRECGSVDELLDTAGLPEAETLAMLCDLCVRGIVTLESSCA